MLKRTIALSLALALLAFAVVVGALAQAPAKSAQAPAKSAQAPQGPRPEQFKQRMAVSPADLMRVAKKYFTRDNSATGVMEREK